VALKKPSDFFKVEKESSLDSVKEELHSSKPEKIERISEAFSAFKSNLNHIQSLTDFSSTFESFKENVEKVETISNEIGDVKKEIQTLIKKEELDDAMMAHLFFVEEAIEKIENKISGVNENIVNKISEDFSGLSEMVNSFLDIDVPKYKNLISESEVRIDNRFLNLKSEVESSLEEFNSDVNEELKEIVKNVETINEDSLSAIREEVGDIAGVVVDLLNEDLPEYKKFFAETELRTEEKLDEAQSIFDEKINFINQTYHERLEELNTTVKEFTETEIPKYSKMLVESKLKSEEEVKELEKSVLEKVDGLTEQIENLYKVNNIKETDIDSLLEKVQTTVQESKNQTGEIFESYARLCKDSKKREVTEDKKLKAFSGRLENFAEKLEKIEETTVQDVLELQANLDISTSAYHERLKKEVYKFEEELVEQMKGLEVNLNTNEVHIKKQNEHIENIKEEVQDVISKLHIDSIEEKNKALIEKVNHIEDVLSKFSEKTLLTEDTPITPGSPDTKTKDPLTSLDQNYVTLKQLQDHYRLFINRIQVQLSSIGGGGAGFVKDLADVDVTGLADNYILQYDSASSKWLTVENSGSSGVSTAAQSLVLDARNNNVGYAITIGTPVYQTGFNSGQNRINIEESRASDSSTMPAKGLTASTLDNNTNGRIIVYGELEGVDTSAFDVADELYVASGGGLTNTRPTGANDLVQKIAVVLKKSASNGALLVYGAGRTNDVPNTISISGNITATDATFSGNVSVAGTITYDDVTHVDSVGIVTARNGIEIGPNSATTIISLEAATSTTTTTDESNIDTFDASVFRSAQYQVQITRGSLYHVTTLNVLHDGTDVYLSEFGTIKTGDALATFDADINSGNVRVRATPAFSSSTVFKISKTLTKI